jgi:hypothetical protein
MDDFPMTAVMIGGGIVLVVVFIIANHLKEKNGLKTCGNWLPNCRSSLLKVTTDCLPVLTTSLSFHRAVLER